MMNVALLGLLFLSQNALCDTQSQTMSLSAYQDCIQSVRLDRHQAYHDEIVNPLVGRVGTLESWQTAIKAMLGLGAGGGIGIGGYKKRKRIGEHVRRMTGTGGG